MKWGRRRNRETFGCVTNPFFYAACKETGEETAGKSFRKTLLYASTQSHTFRWYCKKKKPTNQHHPQIHNKNKQKRREIGEIKAVQNQTSFSPAFSQIAEAQDSLLIWGLHFCCNSLFWFVKNICNFGTLVWSFPVSPLHPWNKKLRLSDERCWGKAEKKYLSSFR